MDIATEGGRVSGVVTAEGFCYPCRAAVLCTGVYLKSRILIGAFVRESGPAGMLRSEGLSGNLARLGIPLRRFKTGTPPRVKRDTLDFAKMAVQEGDEPTPAFSFLHGELHLVQDRCWLTYTNLDTHRIILDNLDRSPLYAGRIHATGTRYCPSIEDKVVKFADKDRHQLFIEPEGRTTQEMYVQGLSTSLPADVQEAMLHTIPGLERAQIMRYGYAIEYDCLDPQVLDLSFMVKAVPGLFSGGQINGSSGYEEAAAQGFYAGVNAALYVKGEPPFIIGRDEGYLGVLVDDLVTKGTPEPYRMMTSRCEYRLLLRQDNADERLTEKARRTGLVSDERYDKLLRKREKVQAARARLDKRVPADEKLRVYLESVGETVPHDGARLFELLKRPGVTYTGLLGLYGDDLDPLDRETLEQIDVMARYDGYIEKERREVERMRSLEDLALPATFDYNTLSGLRLEARQKLNGVKPANIGQASRISGVSPADVSVLLGNGGCCERHAGYTEEGPAPGGRKGLGAIRDIPPAPQRVERADEPHRHHGPGGGGGEALCRLPGGPTVPETGHEGHRRGHGGRVPRGAPAHHGAPLGPDAGGQPPKAAHLPGRVVAGAGPHRRPGPRPGGGLGPEQALSGTV